jgi:periplasmic protein TonB
MFEHGMFADSMLETSWSQRTRRSFTTMTSFALQAVILGLLLLLPLWKTVGLPAARTVSTPVSLGRVTAEPAPAMRVGGVSATQTTVAPWRLMQPSHIPTVIRLGDDKSSPQPIGEGGVGIEGLGVLPSGGSGLPFTTLLSGTRPVLPTPPPSISHTFRTSSMLKGNLIRRVDPVYPPLARAARIQGPVVLAATISKAGTIDNLHALSGPPMLVRAAIDAVSQWRYRPYILNSEPIEVETQITVNFSLLGN